MSEEFIIEEEEQSGGRSRSFITALGALVVLLVAGVACLGLAIAFRSNGAGTTDGEVTEADLAITATIQFIETANAEIAAQNISVTETLAARATQDAQPTETATPTETAIPPTATATATVAPTETPVVSDGDGDGTPEGEGTPADGDGTPEGGGETDATATVSVLTTPISGGDAATATPVVVTGGGDNGTGTLPQTGVSPWGAIVAGLALVLVLFGARRLRSV